jgi:hypothetical protein
MIYSTNNVPEEVFALALNGVYAHGELEDFLKDDILVTDDLQTYYNFLQVKEQEPHLPLRFFDRTYTTSSFAMNGKGETKKVWIFMWYSREQRIVRGFAVTDDDTAGYEYAKEAFAKRTSEL